MDNGATGRNGRNFYKLNTLPATKFIFVRNDGFFGTSPRPALSHPGALLKRRPRLFHIPARYEKGGLASFISRRATKKATSPLSYPDALRKRQPRLFHIPTRYQKGGLASFKS